MATYKERLEEIKKAYRLSYEDICRLAKIGKMPVQKFVFIHHSTHKLELMHQARLITEQAFIQRLTGIWKEARAFDEIGSARMQ